MNHPFARLGQFLKESRIEKGLSQTEVAKKFKYEQQFISNWERGVSSPPLRTLKDLAKFYQVPLEEVHHLLLEDSLDRVRNNLKKAFRRA